MFYLVNFALDTNLKRDRQLLCRCHRYNRRKREEREKGRNGIFLADERNNESRLVSLLPINRAWPEGKSGPPSVDDCREKRDTCRPRGRDDTRSNRFGGVATHKCVYTWTGDTSSRQATSLPSPPFGEGPESRFGSRVTEPFIVNTVNR